MSSRRSRILDARTTDDGVCNLRHVTHRDLVPMAELSEALVDVVFALSDTVSRLGGRTVHGCYPRAANRTDFRGRLSADGIGRWERDLVELIGGIRETELWMIQRGIGSSDDD